MKRIEVECNLCGDVYKWQEAHGKIFNYFCKMQKLPIGSTFEIQQLSRDGCDRHICINCIQTIKNQKHERKD